MTREDDFQTRLDRRRGDWQTRLVFADWLQDRNDPRAEGYRALGVLRLRPVHRDSYGVGKTFQWWNKQAGSYPPGPDDLPDDWFKRLVEEAAQIYQAYSTRREAEDAAALAFAKLPPDRRAELLAGHAVSSA